MTKEDRLEVIEIVNESAKVIVRELNSNLSDAIEKQTRELQKTMNSSVKETVAESIKENVAESIKENIAESIKENVAESIKENVAESVKETVAESVKENIAQTIKEAMNEQTDRFIAALKPYEQKTEDHERKLKKIRDILNE